MRICSTVHACVSLDTPFLSLLAIISPSSFSCEVSARWNGYYSHWAFFTPLPSSSCLLRRTVGGGGGGIDCGLIRVGDKKEGLCMY